MGQLVAIDDWVKQLTKIPRQEFTIPRIEKFTHDSWIQPDTLSPYLYYAKSHYTRNLIFKCDLFEIIAICWEAGQFSAVHNHRGQNCWMAVPIGKLRVQNFRVDDRNPAKGTCRLMPSDAYNMDPQNPGTVRPEQPVHQVLNLAEFNQRATSIHIYSYPYASCEMYSVDRGTYSDVPLHYTSEYGKLNPGERLF
ncbi:MAG TPA: cysteine dioxygenase family protein [Candidatus Acidoferrales bacterium]|nr:cysteine dioxygenase family protein [Candidatus Acidoferrales bacterium]